MHSDENSNINKDMTPADNVLTLFDRNNTESDSIKLVHMAYICLDHTEDFEMDLEP